MSDKRLTAYADRMQEIVKRTEVIDSFLTKKSNALYLPTTVESIYLQFRNILELIATASLIVNDTAQLLMNKQGVRKWHAGDILAAVYEVNPDFHYPKPIRAKESSTPGVKYDHIDFKGDYLTRERFTTLYDICSKTIHTSNPFNSGSTRMSYDRLLNDATKWRNRIHQLLIHHEFKLVNDDDLYIVQVRDEKHGDCPISPM